MQIFKKTLTGETFTLDVVQNDSIANVMATFFQILPKPLITKDQIKLLYYHNVPSGKYKTNFDIGKNFKLNFEDEVEKYCYTWKETGEYAKKKY